MDFPIAPERPAPFPWRTAALVAAGVAAVELLLLVVVGGALLAKPDGTSGRSASSSRKVGKASVAAKSGAAKTKVAGAKPAAPATADLPRRKVRVLVLNGNGRTGAAAAAASNVGGRGYRISAVANAPRHDYPRSLVLFRRGFEGEGVRLARDLGVRVVGPLDGMKTAQLHGAHVVYILGN